MGQSVSVEEQIHNNVFISSLCSSEPTKENIWSSARSEINKLTTNLPPLSIINPEVLNKITKKMANSLYENNLQTGSIGGFILVISEWLCSSSRIDKNEIDISNGLLIFRHFIHTILIESSDNLTLLEAHFNCLPPGFKSSKKILGERTLVSLLMESLFLFLTENPVNEKTYLIHLECVNLIAVLFSTTIYGGIISGDMVSNKARKHNLFLESSIEIKNNHIPLKLVQVLLNNSNNYRLTTTDSEWEGSFLSSMNDVLYSFVSTISGIYKIFFGSYVEDNKIKEEFPQLLGKRSPMILSLLLYYRKNDSNNPNPYLNSLQSINNQQDDTEDIEDNLISISFKITLDGFLKNFDEEMCTLIFYSIFHENDRFKKFVFESDEIKRLVISILHKLYASPNEKENHIYMMLIILTILTEDSNLVKKLFEIKVPSIPWYKDRIIKDINLGSLMMLILLKSVLHDVGVQKDMFLGNNCLAIISNISIYMKEVDSSASQRLLFLISTLNKRYNRLDETFEDERDAYLKFIQIAIEIINTCLTYNLSKNIWLLYELLHQREVFEPLRKITMFSNYLTNIDVVLNHFDEKLLKEKKTWSIDEVISLLKKEIKNWKSDQLKIYEHYNFRYSEDSNTENFFYPFIWENIFEHFYDSQWDLSKVKLKIQQKENELGEIFIE
eukprot:gene4087-7376_t